MTLPENVPPTRVVVDVNDIVDKMNIEATLAPVQYDDKFEQMRAERVDPTQPDTFDDCEEEPARYKQPLTNEEVWAHVAMQEDEEDRPVVDNPYIGSPFSEYDDVDHPSHYNGGEVECIDAIRASMSHIEFCGYLKGNTMKYLWRYRYKGKMVQDLDKSLWYAEFLRDVVAEEE